MAVAKSSEQLQRNARKTGILSIDCPKVQAVTVQLGHQPEVETFPLDPALTGRDVSRWQRCSVGLLDGFEAGILGA